MTTVEENISWGDFIQNVLLELFTSPINMVLLALCGFFLYKIVSKRQDPPSPAPVRLPKLKKRDFTYEELREYDGVKNKDGRILIAVNGKVFDVTRGKNFYGPGGPYGVFAGRDASRGLATFSLDSVPDGYDDLSDLNATNMESVREWEVQFTEKYDFVGKLLKPGEGRTEYSDSEDEAEKKSKAG